MRILYKKINLVFLLFSLGMSAIMAETTPAFPGAEGYGRYVTGGRGGTVYKVTNLKDDGSVGSLRWAVNKSGTRTIVFDVSGTIYLKSNLSIKNGNLTIAGQTAPGDGICLRDYTVQLDADNVIIRFMRFRLGDVTATENDAFWGRNQSNIIIDHCSMSWSTDECASFYDNSNFTMQWCVLSESLRVSVHDKGTHGYAGIWGGKGASFHHNVLAHHDSRNPRFCGSRYSNRPDLEKVDFRNNVIYNWGSNSGYAGEGGSYNMVNNYYKFGPATKSTVQSRIFQPWADGGTNAQPAGVTGVFYVNGNYMYGNANVTNDNWQGIHPASGTINTYRTVTEFDFPFTTTHTAGNAFNKVLAYAGASLARDPLDSRIMDEIRNGNYTYTGSKGGTKGIIDSQEDVGGWPDYQSGSAPLDSDNDAIPDDWEDILGLDPTDAADAKLKNSEGYTMLEVYLNSLVYSIINDQNADAINALPVNEAHTDKLSLQIVANKDAEIQIRANALLERIQVYDVTGRLRLSLEQIENNECNIDAPDLSPGIYVLRAKSVSGKEAVIKILRH
ncbi:MAG: T9SS type A sorting domain-containing protein [Bacteroidales bacterium]|nr:T9SS type A sorting domain-containing protein [Bacteroidales bacterium]